MWLNPSDVQVGKRIRKNVDIGIKSLMDSIVDVGQLQPIIVKSDKTLIFGERRLRACELLERDVWAEEVDGLDSLLSVLKAERDENKEREPWTPGEMVEIGRTIEAIEKPKAKERQEQGANQFTKEGGGSLPQASPGKTREKVADALGVSASTYERAKRVVEAGEKPDAPPEVVQVAEDMKAGNITVNKAYNAIKEPPATVENVAKPLRGNGIALAHEAIAVLRKISPRDPQREMGLVTVSNWINANK